MSISDFFELFCVVTAGMAMPFIVIGSYYNLVPYKNRSKPLTVFFLIISIIYALFYSYFSWKSLTTDNGSWKRIVEGKKTEEEEKGNK